MKWQSMDSAPKDGTTILAASRYSDTAFTVRWDGREWEAVWDGYFVVEYMSEEDVSYQKPNPLHAWMPLPALPIFED